MAFHTTHVFSNGEFNAFTSDTLLRSRKEQNIILCHLAVKTEKVVCVNVCKKIKSLAILYRDPYCARQCELGIIDQQILEDLKRLATKNERKDSGIDFSKITQKEIFDAIANYVERKGKDAEEARIMRKFVRILREYNNAENDYVFV
jgi:hypothetical protein